MESTTLTKDTRDKIRTKTNLNREWKFVRGDWAGYSEHGPEQNEFDDSSWVNTGLPHSFSIPYYMEN